MTQKIMEERMQRMETLFDGMRDDVSEMKNMMKEVHETQIRELALSASKSYVDQEVKKAKEDFEFKMSTEKRRGRLQNWLTGTLSAMSGVILTFLVTFWLNNI